MKLDFHLTSHFDDKIKKQECFEYFTKTIESDDIGFFRLPFDDSQVAKAKEIFDQFKHRKNFIQIGIGGSALGPQMLLKALGKKNSSFVFLDNTDAEDTFDKLENIDLKDSLIYVVSKSGGTAETMANFIICTQKLIKLGVKESDFKDYFVFSTDPIKGYLKEFSSKHNISCLEVPSNVGGRFSVLSSVGLLPALFSGIDIDELIRGAKDCVNQIMTDKENSELIKLSCELYSKYEKQGITDTILMPYSSKLSALSHWFVQLWGESLGKINHDGQATGLTPIPAYGATDQHSQMQLFMEGVNNKFLILLHIKNKKHDFELSNELGLKPTQDLNPYSINQLLEAQYQGTVKALSDCKREVVTIEIDQNNEYSLGQLILFFEALTATMGYHFKIDPFNQPGVELGKKFAFEFLRSNE